MPEVKLDAASLLRDARRKAEECERAWLAGPRPEDCDAPHPFACGAAVSRCLVSTNGGPQREGGWWVEPLLPSQAHLDAHIAAAWQASLASVAGEAWDDGWDASARSPQKPSGVMDRRAATVARLAGAPETREGEA